MKKYLVLMIFAFTPLAFSTEKRVEVVNIDRSLTDLPAYNDTIYYGWELFSWADWLKRPSSGPLLIPGKYDKIDLEVFEAHSAGVVNKPVSKFTKEYLHDINSIRRLDPKNKHQQLKATPFTIDTVVDFPTSWARIIVAAKNTKILDDKSAPYLQMKSIFGFANKQQIQNSPKLSRIVNLLDVNGKTPDAINIQGIVEINQIAIFGSVITFFYSLDNNRTLIVNYFALALKKRILNLGIQGAGLDFTGRSVLLGENNLLNSESGIGAGLPTYTLDFFDQMMNGF